MQSASELVSVALDKRMQPDVDPVNATVRLDQAAVEIVNQLFIYIQGVCPAWRHAWPDNTALAAAKRVWVQRFMDCGVRDMRLIEYGKKRLRENAEPFVPTAKQFTDWCLEPEALGCPSVEKAYRQACHLAHPCTAGDVDAHLVVQHAASETGFYLLANMPEASSRPVFERAYSLALGMYARGEPLRELAKALPAKVSTPADPERVRAALEQMRKTLRRAS